MCNGQGLEYHLLQQKVSSGNPVIDELLACRGFYLLPPHPHYTEGCHRLCQGIHVKGHIHLEDITVEEMAAVLGEIQEKKMETLTKDDLLTVLLGWLLADVKPSDMPELTRVTLICSLLTLLGERKPAMGRKKG